MTTPREDAIDLDNRVYRIVERAANMGSCSQTYHEHLLLAARKVLTALGPHAPTTPREDAIARVKRGALAECECVPGHRCDCEDLRSLLRRILTSAEYPKMEAEGLAADALGLRWSEKDDRYV